MWDNYWFPPSRPIEVKGGIKSRTKRGDMVTRWWACRWISALENMSKSYYESNRLTRGRSYARKGQVTEIEIEKGQIAAHVQGSRPTPYRVSIKLSTIPPTTWKKIIQEASGQIYYVAGLISGEMPLDIENLFAHCGASLFPENRKDIKASCSCPDDANPCKHIAAVYYLVAEEFERDPFLLFTLRGMNREQFMDMLSQEAGDICDVSSGEPRASITEGIIDPAGADDLHEVPLSISQPSSDPGVFWGGNSTGGKNPLSHAQSVPDTISSMDIVDTVSVPEENRYPDEKQTHPDIIPRVALLPNQLGGFPFWRGSEPFLETLDEIYRKASYAVMMSV